MTYREDDFVWWAVEEWAWAEFMGKRKSYSKEMIRRYCRQGNLEALYADAVRKPGGRWEIRAKPLTDPELRTEKALGAIKRLEKLGVSYDSRAGTWHYQQQVAYLMK